MKRVNMIHQQYYSEAPTIGVDAFPDSTLAFAWKRRSTEPLSTRCVFVTGLFRYKPNPKRPAFQLPLGQLLQSGISSASADGHKSAAVADGNLAHFCTGNTTGAGQGAQNIAGAQLLFFPGTDLQGGHGRCIAGGAER